MRRAHSFISPLCLSLLMLAAPIALSSSAIAEGAADRAQQAIQDAEQYMRSAISDWMRSAQKKHQYSCGLFQYTPGTSDTTRPDWSNPIECPKDGSRAVLLVHGLDESGNIWDELAPALHDAGHRVFRLDYSNDQAINDSAVLLADALCELHALGATRVDLVCHSMGGLVARDVLTNVLLYAGSADGHDNLPDIERLICIGTPNSGSPLAPLRGAAELRDHILRWSEGDLTDPSALLGFLFDGTGEAGRDLLPGSDYLRDLNSRPLPWGVQMTLIIGRIEPIPMEDIDEFFDAAIVQRVLGQEASQNLRAGIEVMLGNLGDGVVSVESAELEGVEDRVYVDADHRSMLRRMTVVQAIRSLNDSDSEVPPAIPVILDRLAQPILMSR